MDRILIVDDKEHNRNSLKQSLELDNPTWAIFTAENEEQGIKVVKDQFLKTEPIDVLLTDLVMTAPQGGVDLLIQARTIDPQIMAILFTADKQNLDRFAAYDSGAFDVIAKYMLGNDAVQEINVKTRTALRYREWLKRVNFLQRYFDPKLFERIRNDSSILSLNERLVTICFWDIRGFSLLCEVLKASPHLIAGFLKDYFEEAASSIFEHQGTLDKFIGDGVMAVFGLFNGQHDDGKSDAMDAVQAAITLKTTFNEVLARWMPKWTLEVPQKIEIGLGCGVHTGKVLVGNVGTRFRDQFTALGPHVNFTARIESRANSGQILISSTTEARIKPYFTVYPVGEMNDVKNIPGTYELFNVCCKT